MDSNLVSPSELARLLKISRQAVHKAIWSGRLYKSIIKTTGGLKKKYWIDPSLAKREMGFEEISEAESKTRIQLAQGKHMVALYKAKLLQLEYEIKTGKLINAKDVTETVFEVYGLLRSQLLAYPSRIATILTGSETVKEIEAIVTKELNTIFDDFKVIHDEAIGVLLNRHKYQTAD